MNLVTAGQEFD